MALAFLRIVKLHDFKESNSTDKPGHRKLFSCDSKTMLNHGSYCLFYIQLLVEVGWSTKTNESSVSCIDDIFLLFVTTLLGG